MNPLIFFAFTLLTVGMQTILDAKLAVKVRGKISIRTFVPKAIFWEPGSSESGSHEGGNSGRGGGKYHFPGYPWPGHHHFPGFGCPSSTATPSSSSSEPETLPESSSVSESSTTSAPESSSNMASSSVAESTTSAVESSSAAESSSAPPESSSAAESSSAPPESTSAAESSSAPPESSSAAESSSAPPESSSAAESSSAPPESSSAAESSSAPPAESSSVGASSTTAGDASSSTSSPSNINSAESLILNCHNNYRSQLAMGTAANVTGTMPPGQNIIQLTYSSTVAAQAQGWANQCTMEHSGSSYGENLYMSSSSTISNEDALQQACDSWWSELQENGIQESLVMSSNEFNKGIGHWSQMAWADTAQIGCAVADCPNSTWKTYVVCNYSPAGNILNQVVYEEGTACASCGSGARCNSTSGLCIVS